METKRQLQVAETIKRNFSMVLLQEGNYIYGTDAMVSVTNVIMSPDLGLAKIYVSIYNVENKQAVVLQLQNQVVRMRQLLAHRIKKHVRRIPLIQFYEDETLDEMYKLRSIFDKLESDDQLGQAKEE